jgi:hypothetical protein
VGMSLAAVAAAAVTTMAGVIITMAVAAAV